MSQKKYYLRSTSETGNWNDLQNAGITYDIRDRHQIDTSQPYYVVVDAYGNRVYGASPDEINEDSDNPNQYALWSRVNLPDNFRFNAETGRYEANTQLSDLKIPSLSIFDNSFYTNPNVIKYNTKMDLWKHEHPWLNFAYDAFSVSPVMFPLLLNGSGLIATSFMLAPHLTADAIMLSTIGGGIGGELFNRGIMQKFTPYKSIGDWIYHKFQYPKAVGEALNPGAALFGTVGASIPFGIRNFSSNGGFNTVKDIITYKPTEPQTPKFPENWTLRRGKWNPTLETNYVYSKTPKKYRFSLDRETDIPYEAPSIENLYTEIIDLHGFPAKIALSNYDSNVTFIPHDKFAEIHFGTAAPGGNYVNYQGTVYPAGNPSKVGLMAGMRFIGSQPNNVYFGPDMEVSSWAKRLDFSESTKLKELIKVFTEKYSPEHEVHLTADGWKLNSRPNKHTMLTVSDNSYVSFKSMKEVGHYIEPGKFGKEFMVLANEAVKTNNLKPLNDFLKANNLPLAYFLDGELRLPVIINKTK